MRSKGLLLMLVLVLGGALSLPGIAAAQQSVGVDLAPQAGSGVSGTATVGVQGETSPIVVSLIGLAPGESYPVNLQSGTCEAPSASFGRLGSVTADSSGRAQLEASNATGAAGALVLLTPELVLDGDHVLTVVGQGGVVACGAIPWWGAISTPGLLPASGGVPLAPMAAGLGALGLLSLFVGLRIRR